MGCGSGGCSSGGCGTNGKSASGEGVSGGCGSGGCANGDCGAGSWDGTYRDVAGIKIGTHARTYYFDSTGFLLQGGEACVVEGEHGEEFGRIVQSTGASRKFSGVKGMKKVLRRPTAEDEETNALNVALRREAHEYCRSRIRQQDLAMKLVDSEPSFDGRRITFLFTAEERVDFRELVREIAGQFKRRIEMRQIGARDEAKILGGYGICGRPLCCSTFLKEFAPISIRMAKRQGLSLNPSKISGNCGRLMCCLRYEDTDDRPPKSGGGEEHPPAPPGGAPEGGYSASSPGRSPEPSSAP